GAGVCFISAQGLSSTITAHTHGEVDVPSHLLELGGAARTSGLIHVVVLAAAIAVAVPVTDGVLDGKDAHPLFPVDDGVEGREVDVFGNVLGGAGGAGGIDDLVEVGVVAGGIAGADGPAAEHETIGSDGELLGARNEAAEEV